MPILPIGALCGIIHSNDPRDQPNWIWQSWQKIWIKIYTNPEKSIGAHFTIQRKICPFPGPFMCLSTPLVRSKSNNWCGTTFGFGTDLTRLSKTGVRRLHLVLMMLHLSCRTNVMFRPYSFHWTEAKWLCTPQLTAIIWHRIARGSKMSGGCTCMLATKRFLEIWRLCLDLEGHFLIRTLVRGIGCKRAPACLTPFPHPRSPSNGLARHSGGSWFSDETTWHLVPGPGLPFTISWPGLHQEDGRHPFHRLQAVCSSPAASSTLGPHPHLLKVHLYPGLAFDPDDAGHNTSGLQLWIYSVYM